MAQATVKLYVNKLGYVNAEYPNQVMDISGSDYVFLYRYASTGFQEFLFAGIDALSSSLKNRRLYSASAVFKADSYHFRKIGLNAAASDFNPSTLTWVNRPQQYEDYYLLGSPGQTAHDTTMTQAGDTLTASDQSRFAQQILSTRTVALFCASVPANNSYTNVTAYKKLDNSGNPYIEITYDNSVYVQSQFYLRTGPMSGYANPRNAISVSWVIDRATSETYYCAGGFTQGSAALKWKTSSSSTWNTVNASGSTQNLTVPANTFPTNSTIEWYITGTDNTGQSCSSVHYTFSTAAGSAIANVVSPVNSVEDGSKQITLNWTLSSTDGQSPPYVDLWWKTPAESASNWHAILSHATARTSYTLNAGFFPAGECQWMVRAYNVDDVAGAWSKVNGNYPSFICVAAPDAPAGLQATAVPLTLITWQATGQEAYEIQIDGETVAKAYSPSTNSWWATAIGPLSDGTHTIRVRIQGIYGLWSNWSTVTINVSNVPPIHHVTLTGSFDIDANLSIDLGTGSMSPIIVHWYRDGKRIGRIRNSLLFVDRFVLGEHEYYAELWDNNGNYSRSNTVKGTMKSCETRVALIDYGSPWVTLELSENSDSMQSFSWSQASSLRHIRGAAYPIIEMGESETLTGTYNCAFKNAKDASQLEAMKGKAVIIKSRGGQVLTCAITSLSKAMKDFYITYSFSVQQIHREDFVSHDENA